MGIVDSRLMRITPLGKRFNYEFPNILGNFAVIGPFLLSVRIPPVLIKRQPTSSISFRRPSKACRC